MAHLKKLHPDNYHALFPIVLSEDPFSDGMTLEELKLSLASSDGWTVWDGNELIGAVVLMDLQPFLNVNVHICIKSDFHSRWASRSIFRKMFSYVFNDLCLRRISAVAIPNKTYRAAKLMEDLGFRFEGDKRAGGMTRDGIYYDILNYGMLREECRWI